MEQYIFCVWRSSWLLAASIFRRGIALLWLVIFYMSVRGFCIAREKGFWCLVISQTRESSRKCLLHNYLNLEQYVNWTRNILVTVLRRSFPRNCGSTLGRGKRPFPQSGKIGFVVHTASSSVRVPGCLPGAWSSTGPHTVPRCIMSEVINPLCHIHS